MLEMMMKLFSVILVAIHKRSQDAKKRGQNRVKQISLNKREADV